MIQRRFRGSGIVSASQFGVSPNGTDQTAKINSILAISSVKGVIFDFGAGSQVTVSGTVSGAGKVLRFEEGNSIIGTGILDSCVYDADYLYQIFGTSISHNNAKSASRMTSVMWWGATGNGSTDDQPFLQKASDTVIANNTLPRDLYIPSGSYKINAPWILYSWSGTFYNQISINLIGQEGLYASPGISAPKILCPNFNDTFAIGIQRGTGGLIRGLYIQGSYTSSLSFEAFVTSTFTSRSTSRVSRYSPNCGIVIDPFCNTTTLPPDGGYPGLTSWYRGTGLGSGTSGFRIYDCKVEGFTIGICNSPNGQSQQGEDCTIENTQINYCYVAIAYCQGQSDRCLISNGRSWYYVDKVFDAANFGNQQGVMANVEGYNIAGVVNLIFDIRTANKAVSINKVHAESFYSFGTLLGGSISVTASTFHFALTTNNYQPTYHMGEITQAIFKGCRIGYYGGPQIRIRVGTVTNSVFEECVFYGGPPWFQREGDSQNYKVNFINCKVSGSQTMGPGNTNMLLQIPLEQFVMFGKFTLQDATGLEWSNGGGVYAPVGSSVYYRYDCTTYDRIIYGLTGAISITIATNRSATVSVISTTQCRVDDIILQHGGSVFGRISAIGAGTVTISEIPLGFSSGTYALDTCYYLYSGHPFVGDTAAGSVNITSVSPVWGDPVAGDRVDHPIFPLGTYIVSYNSGTRVLTMSTAANKTAARVDFVNGRPTVEIYSRYPPRTEYNNAFPGGSIWVELPNNASSSTGVPIKWLFNKGGYISANVLGLGPTYQSDLNQFYPMRVNAGVIEYYDSATDTWN